MRRDWPLHRTVLATLLLAGFFCGPAAQAITLPTPPPTSSALNADPLLPWLGHTVAHLRFEGVTAERLGRLVGQLPVGEGRPLEREALRTTLRKLFATGLYENIEAVSEGDQQALTLVFRGTPRRFIGTVKVDGARGAGINAQLEHAAQLITGTRFTEDKLNRALEQMRQSLADNGYHEPLIHYALSEIAPEQLVNIAFSVTSGPQARIGEITLLGDPGITQERFRRLGHLHPGGHVDHNTASRALDGVLKYYQGQQRLEAEVKLAAQHYDTATRKTSYSFTATRGPAIAIELEGATVTPEHLRKILPVFEEGAVDEDLLNESNRRLRDDFQRQGYFDVKVEHERQQASGSDVRILFHVHLGERRKVARVLLDGNHYFRSSTLAELLGVHASSSFEPRGTYSQALVAADINALAALYQDNGFASAKITVETRAGKNKPGKPAPLEVIYHIGEGAQLRIGTVRIEGADHSDAAHLQSLLNTTAGQPLSPRNLAGDRDALMSDYLSRGFDQARVDVAQRPGADNAVDIDFRISEGAQVFVRNVLLSGLKYTRPQTVRRAITLHPGDPLDQSALEEMQRRLYDLSLFSQVDTSIENPAGGEQDKTVLLNVVEARRWTLNYGFGMEWQTGTPQNKSTADGSAGVSERFLGAITRNNLFGREQSASIQGTYGLLEQKIDLLFDNPHVDGSRDLGFTFSGGYANSRDVTTYVASRLQGGMRWTEHFNTPTRFFSKASTMVYEYNFRRVKVASSSLQVGESEKAKLAAAVRVAGPGLTWVRDTRDSALDAHSGSYTSFQEFLSAKQLGAEATFNRLDLSYSNYWSFSKGRFVIARNTRYGQERSFGSGDSELIPLPERMYAGGTTSMRGFGVNAAGPRDIYTGYPIGGAGALVNSTELRLPPPNLPWLGNSVSVVLFHDMGNVFADAGNAWRSALRLHQPDQAGCRNLTVPASPRWSSTGPVGTCSFDYFAHAPGAGLRYHTPVGPIRLDFSYNLNPPIYPVVYNYSLTDPASAPHVGHAPHFNFFFSLGQTF